MTLEQYQALNLRHGTIHSVHWSRTLKNNEVLKDFRGRIVKETIGNFRIGITYENMAINKDKITGSLPYGFFEYSNELIYSPSTNTHQLRLTQTMNKDVVPHTTYYLDGKKISKEELIEMKALGARERDPKPFDPNERPVFNITLDYIIEIK